MISGKMLQRLWYDATTTMDEEEKQSLMGKDGPRSGIGRNQYPRIRWSVYSVCVHVALGFSLVANVYLCSLLDAQEPLVSFPELKHLRYITKSEHATNHTKYSAYSGPPSQQNGASWMHLLQPLYFNISEEELRATGASPVGPVRVKDGGYIASLGIYHELHCLNRLRYALYSQDLTDAFNSSDIDHLDHCLEVLRLSAMCHADLSVYTFTWPAANNSRFLNAHSNSSRRCVDFEQLEHYASKRKIAMTPTLLRPVTHNQ